MTRPFVVGALTAQHQEAHAAAGGWRKGAAVNYRSENGEVNERAFRSELGAADRGASGLPGGVSYDWA